MRRIRLGVNVDHVATLREARKGLTPDPVLAAKACAKGGADSIVCHLREDRRHIQERDVRRLLEEVPLPLNLEMSPAKEIVAIAMRLSPSKVTLVPERRKELTTEGGLDILARQKILKHLIEDFEKKRIRVSLFIDPDLRQLEASLKIGARHIELHTGCYANAGTLFQKRRERKRLGRVSKEARVMGFEVAAGHGLHYGNVREVARIPEIEELNIGHAIVSHAVFVGLEEAVRQMKRLMR